MADNRSVLYLNDPDSTIDPHRVHRATVLGRPRVSTGRTGWRVEIEPPLHGIQSAILFEHHLGTSLDDLVSAGIGITPSWRYVPVYVVSAVAPASVDQEEFARAELTIAAWADAAVRPEDLSGPQHTPVAPRERLPVALVQLERAWRAAGAPILPYLAPGLDAREVRRALRGVGLEAGDEIVTWFGWHNGTAGNQGLGDETWSISGGVFFPSLEQSLALYAHAHEVMEDIAARDGDPSDYYPALAFPITRHLGPYLDVVSCHPSSSGDTWFVSWDGPAEQNGPHLADLIERVARRWALGVERWVDGNWAAYDEALLGIGPNVPW